MGPGVLRVLVATGLLLATLAGIAPVAPAGAAGERWCPPETGACAENAFLDFWRANGALEILGYPLDAPRRAPNGRLIQVYERAVMEWHPENPVAYQVQLARLGALYVGDHPLTRQPPAPCAEGCTLFAETNHTLRGAFLHYWQIYGGLAVYGFPLTEELQERNAADGRTYTVQYFERNRLEYHPEHAGTRHEVQLGRLGAEGLDAAGGQIQAWPAATVPDYGDTASVPPAAAAPAPAPAPPPAPPAAAPPPRSGSQNLACQQLEGEYRAHGMVYDPYQDIQLTVRQVLRFRGVDPAVRSGYREFLADLVAQLALECRAAS